MQSTNLLDVATNVATLMFRANPNANFVRYQSPSFQTSIYSIYLMMKLGDFKSNFISFFSKYFSQNIILTIWNLVNNYALDDIIRIILYSIFIYTNLQNIPNTYIQKINNFSSFLYFAPKSTISVTEFHGGLSKSSNYYFLIDGNNLQHLMAFAVPGSVQKIGFKNPEVLYNVYINDIYDKCVVEFSSSNSGPFSNIEVFPAIDLVLPFDLRRASRKPITYLNNFNFKWITTNEMSFLRKQWTQVYMQMINSIKSISSTLSSLLKYPPIFPSLLNIQMAGINFPLSFLIPYNINARQKSLEGLMKEIHQIWIMLQIITYLKNQARLKLLNLDFSQSSSNPIAIFSCNGQDCSLWYEFDMNPHTMCRGLLWNLNSGPSWLENFYQRVTKCINSSTVTSIPLRPDIVILRGAKNCQDILSNGLSVEIVIECKNQQYKFWSNNIKTQILPYKCIFNPNKMILASMEQIPNIIKTQLSNNGVIAIDLVEPNNNGITQLLKYI